MLGMSIEHVRHNIPMEKRKINIEPYRAGVNVQKVSTKNGYNWHPIRETNNNCIEWSIIIIIRFLFMVFIQFTDSFYCIILRTIYRVALHCAIVFVHGILYMRISVRNEQNRNKKLWKMPFEWAGFECLFFFSSLKLANHGIFGPDRISHKGKKNQHKTGCMHKMPIRAGKELNNWIRDTFCIFGIGHHMVVDFLSLFHSMTVS